jgi:hypothetical protein
MRGEVQRSQAHAAQDQFQTQGLGQTDPDGRVPAMQRHALPVDYELIWSPYDSCRIPEHACAPATSDARRAFRKPPRLAAGCLHIGRRSDAGRGTAACCRFARFARFVRFVAFVSLLLCADRRGAHSQGIA